MSFPKFSPPCSSALLSLLVWVMTAAQLFIKHTKADRANQFVLMKNISLKDRAVAIVHTWQIHWFSVCILYLSVSLSLFLSRRVFLLLQSVLYLSLSFNLYVHLGRITRSLMSYSGGIQHCFANIHCHEEKCYKSDNIQLLFSCDSMIWLHYIYRFIAKIACRKGHKQFFFFFFTNNPFNINPCRKNCNH